MLNEKGRHVLTMIARTPGHRYSTRSQYRSTATALQDLRLVRLADYRAGSARYEITDAGREALER